MILFKLFLLFIKLFDSFSLKFILFLNVLNPDSVLFTVSVNLFGKKKNYLSFFFIIIVFIFNLFILKIFSKCSIIFFYYK